MIKIIENYYDKGHYQLWRSEDGDECEVYIKPNGLGYRVEYDGVKGEFSTEKELKMFLGSVPYYFVKGWKNQR